MSDITYYALVTAVLLLVLMIFKPVRLVVLKIAGAHSMWGLAWSALSVIWLSHVVVLRNFAPRSVVYPTLDDKKTTNAED